MFYAALCSGLSIIEVRYTNFKEEKDLLSGTAWEKSG